MSHRYYNSYNSPFEARIQDAEVRARLMIEDNIYRVEERIDTLVDFIEQSDLKAGGLKLHDWLVNRERRKQAARTIEDFYISKMEANGNR